MSYVCFKNIKQWLNFINKPITFFSGFSRRMTPEIAKSFLYTSNKKYTSSGFTPLLVALGIIFPICGYVAIKSGDQYIKSVFVIIGISTLLIVFIAYFLLLLFKPKEIHSELYLLEDKRLDMIRKQDGEAKLPESSAIIIEPKRLKK
jgi:hypothetical protein